MAINLRFPTWCKVVQSRNRSPASGDTLGNADDRVARARPQGLDHVASPFSEQVLTRTDIQMWCIGCVLASTIFSCVLISIGVLIVIHRHALPGFLEDRCITIDILKVPWIGEISRYQIWHYAFPSTASGSLILLLFVNFLLAILLDAHDRIGSTSLLWLLHKESNSKPKFNTNGRLMSGTTRFGPCHGIINAIAAISMSLCYGSAANTVTRIKVEAYCSPDMSVIDRQFEGPKYGMDISGFPMIILGGALMVQNVISIWTLLHVYVRRKGIMRSWSLDPVVNALYMILDKHSAIRRGNSASVPRERNSLYEQVFRARLLIRIVWATSALLIVAVVIVVVFAARLHSFDPTVVSETGPHWQFWGFVYTVVGTGSKTTDWAGSLVQSGMQGVLAGAMHCADVVLGFKNDEKTWREAHANYAERPNAFIPRKYRLRWMTICLFVIKTVVQWVFSFAVTINVFLAVSLIPLLVVTALFLLIALALEIMARRRPSEGPPTTYGEFRLLTHFVERHHLIWLPRIEDV